MSMLTSMLWICHFECHFGFVKSLGLWVGQEHMIRVLPHCLLKDHKPNVASDPSIRLICPTKSDLGTISSGILDRIVSSLTLKLGHSLWQCTGDVITWFDGLQNNRHLSFMQFDIANCYAFISSILANKAMIFVRGYENVSHQDTNVILSARNILIQYNDRFLQRLVPQPL